MTATTSDSADKLPGLHALRVAAAIGVFIGHAVYWVIHWDRPVTVIAAQFTLGLQLFYVVSAFALMHSTRVYEAAPNWRTNSSARAIGSWPHDCRRP